MADLVPGIANALSQLVRRIVAPNPGLMTGPGTNTYLIGIDEVAVIDPGPDDAKHVEAIIGAAMSERIKWVVLTHTHPDHWPAAKAIVARTGAMLCAMAAPPKADKFDLRVDRFIADGDLIDGTEWGLRVVHTPGHAPNHACLYLEEERSIFTGDHVLNGTTTVVSPKRGGDMAAYMESVRRLKAMRRLTRLLPAHGDVIDAPYEKLDEYLKHRAAREREILKLLGGGPLRIRALTSEIYPDLVEGLVEMARNQVHAQLVKLRAEGKVAGTTFTAIWKLSG